MSKYSKKARVDVYAETTNRIVEAIESALEEGTTLPWRKSWKGDGTGILPVSGATGNNYRGINVLLLWAAGYGDTRWYTYKGAQKQGGQVRKGEKSERIVHWRVIEVEDKETKKKKQIPIARFFSVFNREQIEWEGEEQDEPAPVVDRRADCQGIIEATGIEVRHGGNRAFYNPSADHVRLPNLESFDSEDSYWSVAWHEIVHATGHNDRLGRDLSGRFGDESYAAEELIAELGAAFLCANLGIEQDGEPRPDHAAYLQSWLKVLKNDKRAIFTAAKAAEKAAEWVLDRADDRADPEDDRAEQSFDQAVAAK